MKRFAFMAAGLLMCTGAVSALEVSNAAYYRLVEGSVTQGRGVVFDVMQGSYIEGVWSGGRTIPGEVYLVSHPSARAKKYEITFGADGFPAKGTQLRGLGNMGKVVPFYQGTFKKMYHPFMRGEVGVLHEGVYDTGLGIEYRGVFEYMPAKGMVTGMITTGYFIFYGEKVDREEETKETGLYVSENTPAGTPIRFSQADPSYLTVLQQQYQQDMQIAAGDFKKERVKQNWVKAFSVLYEVSQVMNGGGLSGD
ncbi:MAG: hypothetical protein H7Y06_05880, partial [Opitutaceae bacterium]|nr:hypothetical protein [Opitutaceae bacterium]